MTVISNFLRNADEILYYVEEYHHDKFKPREGLDEHKSIIPGIRSKFSTLKDVDMSKKLKKVIFENSDFAPFLAESYTFIQIQRYLPGDSITVHKDLYNIKTLHLVVLTTSKSDGLVYEDDNGYWAKIYDEAGTYIDVGDKWHFVAPVRDLRYSLVVGQ